ncbi:DUF4274 domain-containing protein [Lysinibacillus agricola]|uniref:DUF4274 domain-containing protein n=1 Tax=Lysinibacillus agricola TaxID=2590012 RepID=UPI003C210C6E
MDWLEVSKSKDIEIVRAGVNQLDPNERDARGRTPIMLFVTNRMPLEGIKLLLERNVELEVVDKLGDTVLKKAVKFKQVEVIKLLLEYGVELNSPKGILATAWNAARMNNTIADLLLNTKGAIRLTLDSEEQRKVDNILYEESLDKMSNMIRKLSSPVLLHAVVDGYNWDDGPEPMIAAFENPACAEITLLDMYELMDGDYWLEQDEEELAKSSWKCPWRKLAEELTKKVNLLNNRI